MKLRIAITVDLTDEQVRDLIEVARSSGYALPYPGRWWKERYLRKYLASQVEEAIGYAHERAKHIRG